MDKDISYGMTEGGLRSSLHSYTAILDRHAAILDGTSIKIEMKGDVGWQVSKNDPLPTSFLAQRGH